MQRYQVSISIIASLTLLLLVADINSALSTAQITVCKQNAAAFMKDLNANSSVLGAMKWVKDN